MERICRRKVINNDFYDDLGSMWIEANDHPIALLRAENKLRVPWISSVIDANFPQGAKVLDIGCGAGFLTNALAKNGHVVTGIDLSEKSLEIAKNQDDTNSVHYQTADAMSMPFFERSFDVICAMDILEHVIDPRKLISQASTLLKPKGLFFFHTFNRNLLSYLLIIKGVDWFVKNVPKNMHVYNLFIKPWELKKMCQDNYLRTEHIKGFRPKFFQKALLKMLLHKTVSSEFEFTFCNLLTTGYSGYARKYRI